MSTDNKHWNLELFVDIVTWIKENEQYLKEARPTQNSLAMQLEDHFKLNASIPVGTIARAIAKSGVEWQPKKTNREKCS